MFIEEYMDWLDEQHTRVAERAFYLQLLQESDEGEEL